MKICNKCRIEKPLDEFYRNKDYSDGHLSTCKSCYREYEKSPAGIERRKRYRSSDKCKEARKRVPSEKWCAYTHKYRTTEKGRQTQKAYTEKHKREDMDKILAGRAIMHAIQKGKITKPLSCEKCGKTGFVIHAHHRSYLPQDRLDVLWVCSKCHKAIHQNTPTSST